MTPPAGNIFGIDRQRGFWLRYFLGMGGVVTAFSFSVTGVSQAQGIVDCVYPGHVAASRVQGRVFDPFGVVVPGAEVLLVNELGSTQRGTTDAHGHFRLAAAPGEYSFKVSFPNFQTSQTRLIVGEDLVGLVRPGNLHVILGMAGSFCSWVTTSQKEFRNIVDDNKKRSEVSAQQNAVQK